MLTVIDEFTRRCLAIIVDRRLNSDNVLHCLTELFTLHGPPDQTAAPRSNSGTSARTWIWRSGFRTRAI